jgi:putative transposase
MDLVSETLFDGRRFRLLPVLDHFRHECLEIVVDQSCRADGVAEAVARLVAQWGRPDAIKVDNGSEFAGNVMDRWAYENGVELGFFPAWFADGQCNGGELQRPTAAGVSGHWFLSLADARSKNRSVAALLQRGAPTVHWHGKPLRNSPENTDPKRIYRRQKRAKSLPADGTAIGDGSSSKKLLLGSRRSIVVPIQDKLSAKPSASFCISAYSESVSFG